MDVYSTREAAARLGIHLVTLQGYLAAKKIPAPPVTRVGGVTVRLWTDADIERARKSMPKIANGRKTRYPNGHSAVSDQQSANPKKK